MCIYKYTHIYMLYVIVKQTWMECIFPLDSDLFKFSVLMVFGEELSVFLNTSIIGSLVTVWLKIVLSVFRIS